MHKRGIQENINDVNNICPGFDKPVVGGSDTHQYKQYGAVYTVLDQPCKNIAELKNVVLNRQFTVEVAPDLHERVSEAVRLKAIAKEKLQEIVE